MQDYVKGKKEASEEDIKKAQADKKEKKEEVQAKNAIGVKIMDESKKEV